ncbi:MAG: YbaB/EbfC family nucleoid-associated protein [Spirochaetaceae bacterium]|nr:YbaB/EbfC family nucleoid-associated protein [Spirochaetaceae bacterium]
MDMSEMMNMLKNPQALQAKAKELQARTSAIRETGQAGGGMAKVTLSGDMEMIECWLSPELIATNDKSMIEDLVRAAHHDAGEKVKASVQTEMNTIFGSMGISPGMFGSGAPFRSA